MTMYCSCKIWFLGPFGWHAFLKNRKLRCFWDRIITHMHLYRYKQRKEEASRLESKRHWKSLILLTIIFFYILFCCCILHTQRPHSHILMTGGGGGGGVRVIFLGLKCWPKVIFLGLWKTPGIFWVAKKTKKFFWVAKKGIRDFFGYAK